MAKSDCLQCHIPTGTRVRGPTMAELAAKYKPDNATLNTLVAKVRSGGTGVWGQEVMPSHPAMSPLEARTIVQYLLSAHETTMASLPLSGTYTLPTSDVDSGRGSVVINAAYTDKGAGAAPWHTTQNITVLRSPRIDPAYADVKSGVDLTTGRNQSMGVIPKPNGYVAFTKIDLTGIKKLDLTVAGRRPRRRRRWRDDRSASGIADRRVARTTRRTRHQPRRLAGGRRWTWRAGAAQAAAATANGSSGAGGGGRPAVAVAGVAAAARSPLRRHVAFRRRRDPRLKRRRRRSGAAAGAAWRRRGGAAPAPPAGGCTSTAAAVRHHRPALIQRPDAVAGAVAAVVVAGAAVAAVARRHSRST